MEWLKAQPALRSRFPAWPLRGLMANDRPPTYRFAGLVLDMARRQLSRDGVVIPLRPKDLEVLAMLVEHHDRAVSKEELFARVWPGTIVDDNNLPRHISTLRKLLANGAGGDHNIETVPGWGYRLTAEVECDREPRAVSPPSGLVAPVALDASRLPDRDGVPGAVGATTTSGWGWRVGAASIAAVFVLGAVGVWLTADRNTPAVESGPRALRQVTYEQGQQDDPSWSPDGSLLAFTSDQAGNRDVYVQRLQGSEITRLTDAPEHDWQPAWSPDGRLLAFRSERDGGGIYLISADGTGTRRVLDSGYRPRWSADGTTLLLSTGLDGQGEGARPLLLPLDGRPVQRLAPDLLDPYRLAHAAWHPDGRQISVWARHPETGWHFLNIRADDHRVINEPAITPELARRIDGLGLALGRFVWAPSGRFLYFEGVAERVSSVWRVGVDATTGAWITGPDRLTTGPGQDRGIAVSPDGTRLAFGILSLKRRIWALSLDPATGRVLGEGAPVELEAEDPVNLSVAQDGRRLVYRSIRGSAAEIRERREDGREHVLLAGVSTSAPHMSLDGTRLAYNRAVAPATDPDLGDVIVRTVGGGIEQPIARLGGRITWSTTDWTPDGSALVGTCREPGPAALARVCVMPIHGAPDADQHVRVLASDPRRSLFVPRFSPDMRWLSFIASDAGRSTVYVMPAAGGTWIPLTDGRFQEDKLRWAPDSRAVYFVSNRSGFVNVWMRRIDAAGRPTGAITQVTDFTTMKRMIPQSLGGMEFAVTPDRLVLPLSEASSRVWVLDAVDR
jgi:Tol biopolymer transport system component/DNA-binding winged helix-turn-helix (wHTH) protein